MLRIKPLDGEYIAAQRFLSVTFILCFTEILIRKTDQNFIFVKGMEENVMSVFP